MVITVGQIAIPVNLVTKTVQNGQLEILTTVCSHLQEELSILKALIWVQTKRDIKDQLKEYQSIIDNFILSKSNLLDRSIGIYKHLWEDFVKFSLSIDPNGVPKYMRWRFKLDPNLADEEITLESTALKYESILV